MLDNYYAVYQRLACIWESALLTNLRHCARLQTPILSKQLQEAEISTRMWACGHCCFSESFVSLHDAPSGAESGHSNHTHLLSIIESKRFCRALSCSSTRCTPLQEVLPAGVRFKPYSTLVNREQW